MLELDINKFEIFFYAEPQGDNYGEVRNPGLKEPITLRLDRSYSDQLNMLHMQLINGQEELVKSHKDEVKKADLNEQQRVVLNMILEGLSHRVIWMNYITLNKLKNNEIDALCVLYHELGHMVYFDESKHINPTLRNKMINNDQLSYDEILADEYAYKKFGDNVITTLQNQMIIAQNSNDLTLSGTIREFEMRIEYLKNKKDK